MEFSRQEYWSDLPFSSPVDHILSDFSTMTCPSWVAPQAWLSFIELDQAVVHVIRFTSFLWLWFQCVCPLMLSRNTYHLTWVSLTLDVGYLFTAAPVKHSHCSLPWTRGISSLPPLLTLNVEWLLSALLHPRSHHSLDVGLLVWTAATDLGHGVAPPSVENSSRDGNTRPRDLPLEKPVCRSGSNS